ncbi:ABC transporter ATP-binding protein [Anaerolineales bacterium]
MIKNSEFRVAEMKSYNQSSPSRWIWSHIWEHKLYLFGGFVGFLIGYSAYSYARILIGEAAGLIINPPDGNSEIIRISLLILIVLVIDGAISLLSSISIETLANRLERDSRHELYLSLLGKTQTFHDRQRVGDIMARATDDVRQLNFSISPGVLFIFDMIMGFVVPITFIATINLQLLVIPLVFLLIYVLLVRSYIAKLDPVIQEQRNEYGTLNASLEETISGIEIVKVTVQEVFERLRFRRHARKYRDLFVRQGQIESSYLPLLVYGVAFGLMFLHSIYLYHTGLLAISDVIAVMGLMGVLKFPVFISLFSLSLFQMGIASARRIIYLMSQEADIDENLEGYNQVIKGDIEFRNVSFSFEDQQILKDVSFSVKAGTTLAIVGQTGSGKSTLTQLISRVYDATEGSITIDNVDVREWNLDSLRSQIGKIEQDVFLFSRTIAENIAFANPKASQAEIEQAAKEAQAHDFISSFNEGYETKIGERGFTLSGGQRQRIALARAFLSNPRILILDDSTSAIDSATEDEIQKAMRRAQLGRTTILITHRLSQIRWADQILVIDDGQIVALGNHQELLEKSELYNRIFARYETTSKSA